MEDLIKRAAALIRAAETVVAFTGAGVSTESGIPDFRSPGGIWEKYSPVYFDDFLASEKARRQFWLRSRATYPVIRDAKPNPTHLALAELEKIGKLDCIITQNIDRLHHKAGNSAANVIEVHGTVAYALCLDCGKRYDRDEIQKSLEEKEELEAPLCSSCQGPLKDATVSFGQAMPEREMAEAMRRAERCNVMLTLGSSLVVYPAASIPQQARQAGAKLIIINREPTPLDHLADVVMHTTAGSAMEQILAEVMKDLR